MDNDDKIEEEVQEVDSAKDVRVKTSKRKFVSQNQFEDLKSTVAGMQNEMSKLVSLLQDSIVPTKRMRTTAPNMTAAQSAEIENQFLIHLTEEQLLSLSPEENQFLTRHDGNQFATTQTGDQFPTLQTSADIVTEDLLAENSPLLFSNETTEGQFVPNFNNGTPNVSLPTATEQQGAKLHFVEDEAIGSPISEGYAKYVEDCCRKRIFSSEIAKFKEAFKRPQNCPALSVASINPNLWAQLPKDYKEHDKRLQNAQSLLAKGLTGIVHVKDSMAQDTPSADQFSLFQNLNE